MILPRALLPRHFHPLRPFSSTGPLQTPQTPLPDRIRQLEKKKPVTINQTVSPSASTDLSSSLRGFLPDHWLWSGNSRDDTQNLAIPIPASHHVLLFNTEHPPDELLPDGTDQQHWPGPPFYRRLWAGGSIVWRRPRPRSGSDPIHPALPDLDLASGWTHPAQCIEKIMQVLPTFGPDHTCDKITVSIERECSGVKIQHQSGSNPDISTLDYTDIRNLVFLPRAGDCSNTNTANQTPVSFSSSTRPKFLSRSLNPTITHFLTPTQSLLSRFSALTMNGHLIHLNHHHCLVHEGLPDLLVHGPLTVCLLLHMVEGEILPIQEGESGLGSKPNGYQPSKRIRSITYRNLAPLFVHQQMRLCAQKGKAGPRTRVASDHESEPLFERWNVWIEGPDGDIRVKGRVEVEGCA